MANQIAIVKDKLATLIVDGTTFIVLVVIFKKWWLFHNRREKVTKDKTTKALKCEFNYSNSLKLCDMVPISARYLLQVALDAYPVQLANSDFFKNNVIVSVIIGHRGIERASLLDLTIKSMLAQSYPNIEIIVVEYDEKKSINLPAVVKHVLCKCSSETPYNRALTFNEGAKLAKGKYLIFHDNDMLVPVIYVERLVAHMDAGYDFVNVKRFIFYLDEQTTTNAKKMSSLSGWSVKVESVVQNAEAGGSVAAIKDSYFAIGGMDESYKGWGGEDNEFWERACTMRTYSYGYMPIIHLWHKPQKEKNESNTGVGYQNYIEHQKIAPINRIMKLKKAMSA